MQGAGCGGDEDAEGDMEVDMLLLWVCGHVVAREPVKGRLEHAVQETVLCESPSATREERTSKQEEVR